MGCGNGNIAFLAWPAGRNQQIRCRAQRPGEPGAVRVDCAPNRPDAGNCRDGCRSDCGGDLGWTSAAPDRDYCSGTCNRSTVGTSNDAPGTDGRGAAL